MARSRIPRPSFLEAKKGNPSLVELTRKLRSQRVVVAILLHLSSGGFVVRVVGFGLKANQRDNHQVGVPKQDPPQLC